MRGGPLEAAPSGPTTVTDSTSTIADPVIEIDGERSDVTVFSADYPGRVRAQKQPTVWQTPSKQ
jgi:hypothetical protein